MRNLFVRLYVLLIVAFVGIGWGLDQFIDGYTDESQLTDDIDIHRGTFFLLAKELNRLPKDQQGEHLNSIASSFGYPLAIYDKKVLTVTKLEMQHLEDDGVVSAYDDEKGSSWFYHLLDDKQAIVIGPVYYEGRTSPIWSIIFLLVIALVVYIWVWPITKGLRELTRTANAFGKGDFSVRASVAATTPLIELVERFNAMAQRIQRLLESHKELSHGVSHELRTPIARLRFAMEMVREVDGQELRNKYLDTMDTNIEELDGLVDELLVYARFDREEPKMDLLQHNLTEVIGSQLARFIETEPQLHISIDSPEFLPLSFDKAAISRIIDNLVRNAVRYAQSEIKVSCIDKGQQIVIYIDDDGHGIPENSREELFKPFVRLDESRDRQSGGIGLGLAIVKRLVNLHQGTVSAGENQTGGARFVIEIPKSLA